MIDSEEWVRIGEKVRKARGELSQDDVCQIADVSRPTYVNLENGRGVGHIRSLEKVARALGFDLRLTLERKKTDT